MGDDKAVENDLSSLNRELVKGPEVKAWRGSETDSVGEFVDKFKKSDLFSEGFEKYRLKVDETRKERIKDGEDLELISEQDLEKGFWESDLAKSMILDFAQNHLMLVLGKGTPSDIMDKYLAYQAIVYDQKYSVRNGFGNFLDADEIRRLDEERTSRHSNLADSFIVAGFAPNDRIGRVMGRLLLISRGYDTFSMTRGDEIKKKERIEAMVNSQTNYE